MKNKILIPLVIYLLMMFGVGFGFGWTVYEGKYEELKGINNNLYKAIEKLENNYDVLEIQYKRDLESCYQQMGDMQDDYDVNNDGVVSSLDLLVLQQYILSQDNG